MHGVQHTVHTCAHTWFAHTTVLLPISIQLWTFHEVQAFFGISHLSACAMSVPVQSLEVFVAGPRGKVVASIAPKAGRALLHRHGDCCLEHEAAAVTSGLKYILRTDVCFSVG